MIHTVHFFWFGGPINPSSVETIKKWSDFLASAQKKSGVQFKIAIWIDKEGSTEQAIKDTKNRLKDIKNVALEFRDISELITEYPEMHRIMRYEIDKLNANYSAASDVGRYTILEKEAGMYLDTDVNPPTEVDAFLDAWKNDGILRTECTSIETKISNSDLLITANTHIPLLQQILEDIPANYRVHFEEPTDDTQTFNLSNEYRYHPASGLLYQTYTARDQDTIYIQSTKRAGPDMLKTHVLQEINYYVESLPNNDPLPPGSLREPLVQTGTAGSWIGRPTNTYDDIDKVLSKISKCIDFELEYMGILRTDDHIQSAIEALGYLEPEDTLKKDALIEQIIALIQEKLASEHQASLVQCCQLTFKFSQTQALYARNHLLIKTGLTPLTPGIDLPRFCAQIHQPFATQYRLIPYEQQARNGNFDIGYALADLAQASSDFRANLLRFFHAQYHDDIVDGVLKFSPEELSYYINILTKIASSDLSLDMQHLRSQLLAEGQEILLRKDGISHGENIRVGIKAMKFSIVSENHLINKLAEKITKLENIDYKTKKQKDKLNLLQKVRDAQGDELQSLKHVLEKNKSYIIREIGIETFALSNVILDKKINALDLDDRPNNLGSRID